MSAARNKKPAPVITAEFGLRKQDGRVAFSLGADGIVFCNGVFPGSLQEAREVAQAINAIPAAIAAMKATLTDVRDPDTDTALARATVDAITDVLMSAGVRP